VAEARQASSAAEIWPLIHEQRNKLGDLLETLDGAEWDTASLCEGWRVRDVVAHCIQTHTIRRGRRPWRAWVRRGPALLRRGCAGW
jgi:uncharacterized protein (TIGR03083 family)